MAIPKPLSIISKTSTKRTFIVFRRGLKLGITLLIFQIDSR